ncbi:hypothetical protein EV191_101771 [Tamaricihabitans halophyticus]|uniref:Uncharacterized protein n=1 Tax=Tamaricihabitans halophyticus TaxID=1262583 RepID=A0A4R2R4I7_9PSEU|nr:hypothetical protein [Tamaricihabitans halophyticus]TCP56824.1 hypothetical protein EV191_101771 [Tamaricihabitans halophyticus]
MAGQDRFSGDGTGAPAPYTSPSDPLGGLVTGTVRPGRSGGSSQVPEQQAPQEPDRERLRRAMTAMFGDDADGATKTADSTGAEAEPAAESAQPAAAEAAPSTESTKPAMEVPPAPAAESAGQESSGARAWPGKPTGELMRMAWRPVQNRLRPARLRKREDELTYGADQTDPTAQQGQLDGPDQAEDPTAEQGRRSGVPIGAVAVVVFSVLFLIVAYLMISSLAQSISSLFS